MARTRDLKPGFFTNEYLVTLPFEARLLFAGLWTIADRQGRLEDRPVRIKMQLFPNDAVDVETLLDKLASTEEPFIARYEVDGRKLIQVLSWQRNQRPHPMERESDLPPMPGWKDMPKGAPKASGKERKVLPRGAPKPSCTDTKVLLGGEPTSSSEEHLNRRGRGVNRAGSSGSSVPSGSSSSTTSGGGSGGGGGGCESEIGDRWERARELANQHRNRLPKLTTRDHKRFVQVAYLAANEFGEDLLLDPLTVVEKKRPPPDDPYALWWTVTLATARDLGCDLESRLERLHVPDDVSEGIQNAKQAESKRRSA